MDVTATPLSGLLILRPRRFQDARGYFCETYNKRRLGEAGIFVDFIQDNVSYSEPSGTLRGLHFQRPPFAQHKLVSVVRGAALDVVVDLRRSSASFGRHFALELNETDGQQLFVPIGCAHGFITLTPDTLFAYKVSSFYAPDHDAGIRFDDPTFGIDWTLPPEQIVTSDKDSRLPFFDPSIAYFE